MDKFEPGNRNGEPMNFNNSSNLSSDWPFSGANMTNTSMAMLSSSNPIVPSSCSSAAMLDSFCPTIWDQPTISESLGYSDISLQNNANSSSTLGFRKGNLGPARTLDMSWNPSNPMVKGSMFLPNASAMLPQSLSQFPADSGFIERAARFSCFNAGNISDMINPFNVPESLSPYSRGLLMQGPQEGFTGNGSKVVSGEQSQKNEMNMDDVSKDVSMTIESGGNERQGESLTSAKSQDEAKQGTGVSVNESDEAGCSDSVLGQEETSNKGPGSKKRRRGVQDKEFNQFKANPKLQPGEITKNNNDIQGKGDKNQTPVANKSGGKQGKQGSPASDTKEDYIHIRARRGQATNSHSLAERVRREKISERMKFLQDIVPGCNKVTGKAVMLDEIINYVQSLQRQVEFLSMKLATVNPRLDFNMEGLLTKEILQSQAGPSSTLGFSPEMSMPYPSLSQFQPGIIQASLAGLGSSSDAIRRTINSHLSISGAYKEASSQVPNVWEDELHNIIQMGLNPNIPLTSQDLEPLPPGHLKAEP